MILPREFMTSSSAKRALLTSQALDPRQTQLPILGTFLYLSYSSYLQTYLSHQGKHYIRLGKKWHLDLKLPSSSYKQACSCSICFDLDKNIELTKKMLRGCFNFKQLLYGSFSSMGIESINQFDYFDALTDMKLLSWDINETVIRKI
jgi:hypothetical protein